MLKNFVEMPVLLKLLVVSTLVTAAFLLRLVVPYGGISAFGRIVSVGDWWRSGAGVATAATASVFISSAILMLKRSQYGRALYVLGWVASSLSILIVANMASASNVSTLPSVVANLILAALIALYLYLGKAPRDILPRGTDDVFLFAISMYAYARANPLSSGNH